MSQVDRKRKSRKLVGGRGWFRQSPVGEEKKYESASDKKKDVNKLKNEIRELEEKIDNEKKDKKKAVDAIEDAVSKNKKELEQKRRTLIN